MAARRFPPPWSVEEQPAYFVVRDHNGQQLAYNCFEVNRADALLGREFCLVLQFIFILDAVIAR
jgi:hypothetical protein